MLVYDHERIARLIELDALKILQHQQTTLQKSSCQTSCERSAGSIERVYANIREKSYIRHASDDSAPEIHAVV